MLAFYEGPLLLLFWLSLWFLAAHSQEPQSRKELKRAELTGTNMEVVESVIKVKPGEALVLHIHHGEEAFYVLDGATIELPDGKQMPFPAGTAGINRRDVPHGALKVVGDKTLRYLTVHVVDKGMPLYDAPR